MIPWLAISSFAIFDSLLCAASRAGFGIEHALNSRYAALSIQLPIGLVFLTAIVCADRIRRQNGSRSATHFWVQLPAMLLAVLVMLQLMILPQAIRQTQVMHLKFVEGKGALLLAKVLPENPTLAVIHPTPQKVIETIRRLDELGYISPPLLDQEVAKYQVPDQEAQGAVTGNIEQRGPLQQQDPRGTVVGVSGWAYCNYKGSPADTVFLTYQNPKDEPIILTAVQNVTSRPDIVAETKDSSYELTGWQCLFGQWQLPQMPYTVICAWVLDTETGQAYRIQRGPFALQIQAPATTQSSGSPPTGPTTDAALPASQPVMPDASGTPSLFSPGAAPASQPIGLQGTLPPLDLPGITAPQTQP